MNLNELKFSDRSGEGLWGLKPFYFDPVLGHHEPRLGISFKSRVILVYSFTHTKPNTNDVFNYTHQLILLQKEGRSFPEEFSIKYFNCGYHFSSYKLFDCGFWFKLLQLLYYMSWQCFKRLFQLALFIYLLIYFVTV